MFNRSLISYVFGFILTTTAHAEWTVKVETSLVDDSQTVTLSSFANRSIYDKFNRDYKSTLVIQCREGETDLYIVFGGLFMSDNRSWGDVKVRVDKEKAQTFQMDASTDHQALGLWRGEGIKLIKKMFNKNKMLVVATPLNESSVDTEFEISGLEKSIEKLRASCAW